MSNIDDYNGYMRRMRLIEKEELIFEVDEKTDSVMLTGCNSNVTGTIIMPTFITSVIENMSRMFCYTDLEMISLNGLPTGNVTNMSGLFENCHVLTHLKLDIDTANVKDMSCMFYHCNRLTELDLSSFDTGKVENMCQMFAGCSSLTKLDLHNSDISNVKCIDEMFADCDNLTIIKTPKKSADIVPDLPEGTWIDSDGNTWTQFPANATESIVLTKVSR